MKIKLSDGLVLGGITVIVLVNPLVGQYIIQGIIYAYEQLLLVADYFMILGLGAIVLGYFMSKGEKRTKYNMKLKKLSAKKTASAGTFID